MRALFCNTSEPRCGVHVYGSNLYDILKDSQTIHWDYYGGCCLPPMSTLRRFDLILYNWSSLIGGWMQAAPMKGLGKQVFIFHDGPVSDGFDAILFSDPTMTQNGKWHSIGRPIPQVKNPLCQPQFQSASQHWKRPIVGVYGFIGAWADQVVSRAVKEFEYATIALSLPFSTFCDPDGIQARAMASRCREMTSGTGVDLQISHDFMDGDQLVAWLARNDLNCFVRPVDMNWRGVSSAPDYALAARRPIAVNKCNAFRHLHGLSPSICVEDTSLSEILITGLSPLVPLYSKWHPDEIRKQVETVLLNL